MPLFDSLNKLQKSRARDLRGTIGVKIRLKMGNVLGDTLGDNPDDGGVEQLVAGKQQN
jgi:hypothetical protein